MWSWKGRNDLFDDVVVVEGIMRRFWGEKKIQVSILLSVSRYDFLNLFLKNYFLFLRNDKLGKERKRKKAVLAVVLLLVCFYVVFFFFIFPDLLRASSSSSFIWYFFSILFLLFSSFFFFSVSIEINNWKYCAPVKCVCEAVIVWCVCAYVCVFYLLFFCLCNGAVVDYFFVKKKEVTNCACVYVYIQMRTLFFIDVTFSPFSFLMLW